MSQLLIKLLARCAVQSPFVNIPCYTLGQTKFSANAVLSSATSLQKSGVASHVLVGGESAGSGYEGGGVWSSRLIDMGVPKHVIVPVMGGKVNGGHRPEDFNTLTELRAVVKYLRETECNEIILIAPDFHLPRTMVSFITALQEQEGPFISAWGHAVKVFSWDREIVHSQGITKGTIEEIFAGECNKIDGPTRYKNLVSLDPVIAYLNKRDSIA